MFIHLFNIGSLTPRQLFLSRVDVNQISSVILLKLQIEKYLPGQFRSLLSLNPSSDFPLSTIQGLNSCSHL